jgi:AcrR family transcriptional regulator
MRNTRLQLDLAALEDFAAQGLPVRQIAARVGCSYQTLHDRLEGFGAQAAYRRGLLRHAASVARQTLDAAQPSDATALPSVPAAPGAVRLSVVAAVAQGARTFAELMTATNLPYDALVIEVQREMCTGQIKARVVAGVRRHFLAREELPQAERETAEAETV